MERGPSDVALKANISLGKSWLPSFDLTEEQDFVNSIYKPMVAAYKNKKTIIEDLGYWSRPYKLGIYDVEAISYSIPLRDKDGEPYGVIGIDLTLDYLRKLLNYDELADNKQAAYLLAIGDKAGLRFENVLINGPMFKGVLDIGGQTVLMKDRVSGYLCYAGRWGGRCYCLWIGTLFKSIQPQYPLKKIDGPW